MGNEIMSLKNIEKRYPGVIALHRANISFRSGEVHTLLGENGAGKSTLITNTSHMNKCQKALF